MNWDQLTTHILDMRNRRRTPINPPKAKKAGKARKKKQPKALDIFAVANTMVQQQKDDLLRQLTQIMEEGD
jgi:hypothetical protein